MCAGLCNDAIPCLMPPEVVATSQEAARFTASSAELLWHFTERAADAPHLLHSRMLEVTTLGMEKRLGLDFAQVYKQSKLNK